MRFKPHQKSEARRSSAVTLIKYLLAETNPDVELTHLRQLLTILLWKITEAESSKHKTRFQSQDAINCGDKARLRHDHVFQRSRMIDRLLTAAPEEIDDILKGAIGCTVTVEEHARLSRFDAQCDGWERYEKAGVVVIDTETGEPFASNTPYPSNSRRAGERLSRP